MTDSIPARDSLALGNSQRSAFPLSDNRAQLYTSTSNPNLSTRTVAHLRMNITETVRQIAWAFKRSNLFPISYFKVFKVASTLCHQTFWLQMVSRSVAVCLNRTDGIIMVDELSHHRTAFPAFSRSQKQTGRSPVKSYSSMYGMHEHELDCRVNLQNFSC